MKQLSLNEQLELVLTGSGDVAAIRTMFLELAVNGKLVEQRREDGTLAADIERCNRNLEHRSLSTVGEFELPDSWGWLRLGDIGKWGAGATPLRSKHSYYGGNIPWFKSGELTGGVITVSEETITELAVSETSVRINEPGTVLIAMYGATIGKTAIAGIRCTTNQAVCGCVPLSFVNNDYLHLLLKAFKSRFVGQGAGGAQPNISKEKIVATAVPLPPLAEQKRIVAKVDQLMALCDELEAKQNAQRQLGTRLTRSALDALTTATTPDEFTTAWHRLCKNFEAVLPTVVEIAAMKRKVGELAVRGLLTSRSAKDRPYVVAHASLSKVTYEPVAPAEYPYDVPPSWTWLRFGELGNLVGGGTPSKANDAFWRGTIPWVSPKDMKRPIIDDAEDHISDAAVQESSVKMISNPSLLFVVRGMILAHSFPVALTSVPVTVNQDMKACVFHDPAVAPFVLLLMQAARDRVLSKIERSSHGTCRLDAAEVARMPIAIPPLTEQREILEQVTRLSRFCDELSARLEQSESCAANLAASLVQQLVSQ